MPRDPDKPIIGGLDYEALVRVVRLAVTEGLREALAELEATKR